jgi:hypothetical protein
LKSLSKFAAILAIPLSQARGSCHKRGKNLINPIAPQIIRSWKMMPSSLLARSHTVVPSSIVARSTFMMPSANMARSRTVVLFAILARSSQMALLCRGGSFLHGGAVLLPGSILNPGALLRHDSFGFLVRPLFGSLA